MRYVLHRLLLLTLACAIIFTSCSRKPYCERAKSKVADLCRDCPGIIDTTTKTRIDTVIVDKSVSLQAEDKEKAAAKDQKYDSLLQELKKKCPELNTPAGDSLYKRVLKEAKNTCSIENLMAPITFDSAGVKVKIWAKGNKLSAFFIFPERNIEKETEHTAVVPCPEFSDWEALQQIKKPVIIFSLIMLVSGFILGLWLKR